MGNDSTSRISIKEIKQVSKLANLSLTDKEISTFQSELDSVLEYVSVIQSLDTTKTTETHQVTGLTNIFREDNIEPERVFSQKEALKNAKHTHDGYFVVPAVIKLK